MKKLRNHFSDKPNSSTSIESIFTLEGIYEYIEDVSWGLDPMTCDPSCAKVIARVLDTQQQARIDIQHALEYEMENGRGSYKRYLDSALNEMNLPELVNAISRG